MKNNAKKPAVALEEKDAHAILEDHIHQVPPVSGRAIRAAIDEYRKMPQFAAVQHLSIEEIQALLSWLVKVREGIEVTRDASGRMVEYLQRAESDLNYVITRAS